MAIKGETITTSGLLATKTGDVMVTREKSCNQSGDAIVTADREDMAEAKETLWQPGKKAAR